MLVLIWHSAPLGRVLELASQKCMGKVKCKVQVDSKRMTTALLSFFLPFPPSLPLLSSSLFLTPGSLLVTQYGIKALGPYVWSLEVK